MSQQITNQRTVEAATIAMTTHNTADIGDDPLAWLKKQGRAGMTLLLHSDEVVLWGRMKDDDLHFPPQSLYAYQPIRPFTVQSARLFDTKGEIFLWRVEEKQWLARTVTDCTGDAAPVPPAHGSPTIAYRLDEAQVLWGTQVEVSMADFCRVSDGQQGLVHAPPLALPVQQWANGTDNLQRNLRLQVRHYLTEDPTTGWLRIAFSRLVDLYAQDVTEPAQPAMAANAAAAQLEQTTGGGQ